MSYYTTTARGPRQIEAKEREPDSAARPAAVPSPEAVQASNLAELLAILRRRWKVIFWSVLIITAAAIAVLLQIKHRYTAEAMVMLDARKPALILSAQQQPNGLEAEGVVSVVLKTETEVLRSPALAEKVIDKLGLLDNPEFNPTLKTSWSERLHEAVISALPAAWAARLDSWWPLAPAKESKTLQRKALAGTIDTLLDHLTVSNDGKSYILHIKVESVDPKLAADIANTYTELYLVTQLDAKYQEASRVNSWLNDRLAELRDKVRDTDRAVQLFKQEHNITTFTDAKGAVTGTLRGQQVSELNSQLILATADRTQKEAVLRALQDAQRRGKGAAAATKVLGSPVIQHLLEQEADVMRRKADLSANYGPQYPAMIRVNAELSDLKAKLDHEVNKVIRSASDDLAAARTRESTLRANLKELQGAAAQQDQAEVQLRELVRQADANKTLYEAFLQKFKLSAAQQEIEQPEAHVVSAAQVPVRPSWPPRTFFTGVALLLSTLVGVALAFALERLDNSFRGSSEIESLSGLPNLGLIPMLGAGEEPRMTVISQPMSVYTESVRSVWTALRHQWTNRPPKVVLVTSAVPGEGKSTLAISLAQAAARSGARTLLIDCDLRRPTIGKALKVAERLLPSGGVVDLLNGSATLDSVIFAHPDSGIELVLSGSSTGNPQALLQSSLLQQCLGAMRNEYDCIVIDSPPVLLASDASILSQLADATLLAVRWEKTPRNVALNGLKTLRATGGFIAGTVLTQVDLRKQARYGFGDVGYYYKSYRHYAA